MSCYAIFKGWLLLSQPPSCLNDLTSLPTKHNLGTLADGPGCFPFVPRDFPAALTPWNTLRIRSLVGVGTTVMALTLPVLYLRHLISRGYTSIYFGENQLMPSSISVSPLTTAHPSIFPHTTVRTFTLISQGFILAMVSSPGFGSNKMDWSPY